jgi:hypothetical protein
MTTNNTLKYRPLTNPLMSRDMHGYLNDFMAAWQADASTEDCVRIFREYAEWLSAAARAENARGWKCKAADWTGLAKMLTDRADAIEATAALAAA